MESTAISLTLIDPDEEFIVEYQRTCITSEASGSYTARSSNLTLRKRTRVLAHRLAALPDLFTTYSSIPKKDRSDLK